MARRLFSTQIVDSDAFLDMPPTAQNLYFHLGMRADDDGFVGNPKKILKIVGGNDDDIKVLIMKRFILIFESGVVVIKHWLIHNSIRKDRYNTTQYLEEKSKLRLKENKAYTDDLTIGQPLGNQMATQGKLSQGKLSKTTTEFLVAPGGKPPIPPDTFLPISENQENGLFSHPVFVQGWQAWLRYRKENGFSCGNETLKVQLRELEQYQLKDIIPAMKKSISAGWKSINVVKSEEVDDEE